MVILTSRMQFSFVIPCYNNLSLTKALYASLLVYLPVALRVQLVFVDDCSTDNTANWLRGVESELVKVIVKPNNNGFANSVNQGVEVASGEFVVILNNDLELTRGWLLPFLQIAKNWDPGFGLVGNIQRRVADGAVDHSAIVFNNELNLAHSTSVPSEEFTERPLITGACIMLRRDVFLELGGFDTSYTNGCEDVDLCMRLLQAGKRNWVANRSVVYHHVSASRGVSNMQYRNSLLLFKRWGAEFCRMHSQGIATEGPPPSLEVCQQLLENNLRFLEHKCEVFR